MSTIKDLMNSAKTNLDYGYLVELAYELGMWWKAFPPDTEVNRAYNTWNAPEGTPDAQFAVSVYSEKGDSWHPIYRQFRELGWKRIHVSRNGRELKYYLKMVNEDFPPEFQERVLCLNITIQSCRVEQRTVTKEVVENVTICDELVEVEEDHE